MTTSNREHKLFKQFPISGDVETSAGSLPTPYHVYDGYGLLIGGTANSKEVTRLLAEESVSPILTDKGDAIVGIWCCDFTDASLGAHTELQISILVSHEKSPPIKSHPFALLNALISRPEARMLCLHLWNNTTTAVTYNREVLGLNAELNSATINHSDKRVKFQFRTVEGSPLLEGNVDKQAKTTISIGLGMFRLFGPVNTLRLLTQPYLETKVVNTKSPILDNNLDARALLASRLPVVHHFDYKKDQIMFRKRELANLRFQPSFLEHFKPFRFVYTSP